MTFMHDELKNAIKKSGYLLEMRIFNKLLNLKLSSEANYRFPSSEPGKSREIDIHSYHIEDLPGLHNKIWFNCFFECENNEQPVVFFPNSNDINYPWSDLIHISGHPTNLSRGKGSTTYQIQHILKLSKYNLFAQPDWCSQYCTFKNIKANKNQIIALHDDRQHDTITKLIDNVCYISREENESVQKRLQGRYAFIDLTFTNNVIVLHKEMYGLQLNQNQDDFDLAPISWVKYCHSYFDEDYQASIAIDIITESFLEEYVALLREAWAGITKSLVNNYKRIIDAARFYKDHKQLEQDTENDK